MKRMKDRTPARRHLIRKYRDVKVMMAKCREMDPELTAYKRRAVGIVSSICIVDMQAPDLSSFRRALLSELYRSVSKVRTTRSNDIFVVEDSLDDVIAKADGYVQTYGGPA